MSRVFFLILDNAITVCWIIPVIIILRLLLKKAPKWIICTMWVAVAVRLCVPFSIESPLSLVPSANVIPDDNEMMAMLQIASEVSMSDATVNPMLPDSLTPAIGGIVNPAMVFAKIGSTIWLVGMAVLFGYAIVSSVSLNMTVKDAKRIEKGVFKSSSIKTPFILGMVVPRIYLPFSLDEEEAKCVLAHEHAHIKRGDYIWKPLGFAILSIYWFNPLVWVAYILLCKDIEFACDEKATIRMSREERAKYCQTLLDFNSKSRKVTACPVAFGEVSVKGRIKSVLNYKKPAAWVIALCVVALGFMAVCFLTNPVSEKDVNNETETENMEMSATKLEAYEPSVEEPTMAADKIATEELAMVANGITAEAPEMFPENIPNEMPATKEPVVLEENASVTLCKALHACVLTLGFSEEHPEVDLAAPKGTEVMSAFDGTVIETGYEMERGNYIIIQADGLEVSVEYAHLDEIKVAKEAKVTSSEVIATVGSTGRSTGPHLSFKLLIGETAVNPLDYIEME